MDSNISFLLLVCLYAAVKIKAFRDDDYNSYVFQFFYLHIYILVNERCYKITLTRLRKVAYSH